METSDMFIANTLLVLNSRVRLVIIILTRQILQGLLNTIQIQKVREYNPQHITGQLLQEQQRNVETEHIALVRIAEVHAHTTEELNDGYNSTDYFDRLNKQFPRQKKLIGFSYC